MIVKLLTEHHLEEAAEACPSLHMSKCHIIGNLMHWLIHFYLIFFFTTENVNQTAGHYCLMMGQ